MSPADRRPFLPGAVAWSGAIATAVSVLGFVVSGGPMALGIAMGTLLGVTNLWLLSRAVDAMVQQADQHRPAPGRKWALPGVFLLKWPFLLLALAGILWYMPARPEGVAIGFGISLLGAAIAATRNSKTRPST
jgi:hypothetical protein